MALRFSQYPEQSSPGYFRQSPEASTAMQESAKAIGEGLGTSMAYGAQQFKSKIGALGPLGKAWREYKSSGINPVTQVAWNPDAGEAPMSFKNFKRSSYGKIIKDQIKYDRLQKRFNLDDDEMQEAMDMAEAKHGSTEGGVFTNWLKSDEGKEFRKGHRIAKRKDLFAKTGGDWVAKTAESIKGIPGAIREQIPEINLETPYGGILGKIFTPGRHDIRETAATGGYMTPEQLSINLAGTSIGLPPGGVMPPQKQFADWYGHVKDLSPTEFQQQLTDEQQQFYLKYGDLIEDVITKQKYKGI